MMENPQQESETPSGDPLGGLDGRELDREIEREGGATYRTGETTRSRMSYRTTTTIVIILEGRGGGYCSFENGIIFRL